MKNIKLKNKLKSQRGSVTIFVITSMIFFATILLSIYMNNSNKNSSMNKDIKKVEEQYSVTDADMEQAYQDVMSQNKYTPLEYLESTGTQWIDTEFVPNNSTKLEIEGSFVSAGTGSITMAGTAQSGTNASYFAIPVRGYNGTSYYYYNSFHSIGSFTLGDRLIATLQNTGTSASATLYNKTTDMTYNNTQNGTLNTTLPIYLFACNSGNRVVEKSNSKIYYAKLWDNGILARDFIPVLDENMVPCLYDKVQGKFYYNQGTGYFKTNLEFQRVDYLKATGTQYIDTGIVPGNNTSVEIKASFNNISDTGGKLFGYRTSTTSNRYVVFSGGSGTPKYYFDYGNGSQVGSNLTSDNQVHIFKADKNILYVDGTAVKTNQSQTFTCGGNAYLFACNQNGSVNAPINATIYYCKIWDNGTLVRDYIPVLDGNGVACMYDKVSGEYFYNSGSGDFKTNLDE